MGQSAAQPILDWPDKLKKLGDWIYGQDKPKSKVHPSDSDSTNMNWKPTPNAEQQKWLDEHGYGQKKLAARKPLGSAKKTAKKTGKKQTARKR